MNEALIEKIVRVVIETLQKSGMLKDGSENAGSCPTCTNTKTAEARVASAPKGRKTVVTEETIRDCAKKNQTRIVVPKNSVITPSARDTAKDKGIEIIFE